ncbi:MAG: ROK family protein [Candidatus Omnitrophota bacterium]
MRKRVKIGIDVGGTLIKMGLVDERAGIHFRREVKTPSNISKIDLINYIISNIEAIIYNAGVKKRDIAGIGMGVPGLVDSKRGIVHGMTNIRGWKDVPLKSILEKRLRLKVEIDNDVNAMTLAEHKFGAGKGADNMVCVTLGTGVGGGIIISGCLYRGNAMSAGEIGHVPINENGPKCNCGGTGCLESYIGNRRILIEARKAFNKNITLEALSAAANKGDKKARAVWEAAARRLAVALSGVINLLNPDRIIIGGGVSKAGNLILGPLRKEIACRAMDVPARHVKIRLAELGSDAGIIGASLLILS